MSADVSLLFLQFNVVHLTALKVLYSNVDGVHAPEKQALTRLLACPALDKDSQTSLAVV